MESTVIIIDNTEWARNGDYGLTRLTSQVEIGNQVTQECITGGNKSMAVITMANKANVRVTLTNQMQRLNSALYGITLDMVKESDIWDALRIALLILKHRPTKQHSSRVFLMVCSPADPLSSDEYNYLRKIIIQTNTTLDILCFGDGLSLVETFRSLDRDTKGAHVRLMVPEEDEDLLDVLRKNNALNVPTGALAGANPDDDYDPELEYVLKLSMEEHMMNQTQASLRPPEIHPSHINSKDGVDEADEELQRAISRSLTEYQEKQKK